MSITGFSAFQMCEYVGDIKGFRTAKKPELIATIQPAAYFAFRCENQKISDLIRR